MTQRKSFKVDGKTKQAMVKAKSGKESQTGERMTWDDFFMLACELVALESSVHPTPYPKDEFPTDPITGLTMPFEHKEEE